MGLSMAMAGGIVAITVLAVFSIVFPITEQIFDINSSRSQNSFLESVIEHTGIEIENMAAFSGSSFVNFTLKNTGLEKLWNYEDFFLAITYDADVGGVNTRKTEILSYDRTASFLGSSVRRNGTGGGGIAFDSATPFSGNCSPCGFSHTVGAGSDRILIVGVTPKIGGAPVTSVTYGAQSLTQIRSDTFPGVAHSSLWYLVAPTSGTDTVTVTLSVSEDVVIGAISFSGVDQSNPIDAHNGNNGVSATPSVSLTTNTNNAWIVDTVGTLDGPLTEDLGQVERWDLAQGTTRGAGSTRQTTSAGSYTMGWTNSAGSKEFAISAAALRPAGGGSIALDSTSSLSASCSSCSFPHTVGVGSNKILIVGVSPRDDNAVLAVTYASQSLTQIRHDSVPGVAGSSLWYLLNPPSGTANVIVTFSSTTQTVIGAISFFGVDQLTPIEAHNGNNGNSATPSVSLTTLTYDAWIVDTVGTSGGPLTEDLGQVERWDLAQGQVAGAGSTRQTINIGSYTMGWTNSGGADNYAISAAALRSSTITSFIICSTNANFDTQEWIIANVTTDYLDPNIVNSHEIAVICTRLPNPVFAAGNVTVSISTDNGKNATRSITTQ